MSSSLELTDEDNNQKAEKEGNGDKGTIGDWCVLLIPQRLSLLAHLLKQHHTSKSFPVYQLRTQTLKHNEFVTDILIQATTMWLQINPKACYPCPI